MSNNKTFVSNVSLRAVDYTELVFMLSQLIKEGLGYVAWSANAIIKL